MMPIRHSFFLLASLALFAGAHLFAEPPASTHTAPIEPVEEVGAAVSAKPEDTPKTPPPDAEASALSPTARSTGELRDLTAPSKGEEANKSAVVEREVEQAPAPRRVRVSRNGRREVVSFGSAYLPADERAQTVVAILGNAQANGPVDEVVVAVLGNSEAREDVGQVVVAVLGNATAEKRVGDSVVAVLGDARVNGHVHGQVVSVFGTIWLGPNAEVDGEVVSVGGTVERSPSAIVHGQINEIAFLRHIPMFGTLGLWFQQAILKGRLLSLHQHLVWPWTLAFGFLGFYFLLALGFGPSLTRCAETLEQRPLKTVFAALLALVVAPALMVVLLITVIGAAAVFFAFLSALIFGKAAFLAWIGRRFAKPLGISNVAVSVLLGGVLVVVLYTLPVIGLFVWMIGSTLGLGMSVYTVILTTRRDRAARVPSAEPRASATPAAVPSGITASATPFPTYGASASVPPLPQGPPAAAKSRGAVPPLVMPVSTAGYLRAGFWIRLAASLLDAVLVAIASSVLHLSDLFLLLLTAYSIVMWAKKGTTVGGIICGLKVVRVDDRPLDWTVAVVRALGAFLSLCVAGLGFIWVAFDNDKQSWHDKIAGTTVVHIPKGVSLV